MAKQKAMKVKSIVLIVLSSAALTLSSCHDLDSKGKTGKTAEDVTNEQGKSDVTRTGQRIGATADSTSVDGKPGNVSSDR